MVPIKRRASASFLSTLKLEMITRVNGLTAKKYFEQARGKYFEQARGPHVIPPTQLI